MNNIFNQALSILNDEELNRRENYSYTGIRRKTHKRRFNGNNKYK